MRGFAGSRDKSAVVLSRTFPFSNLVLSMPFSNQEKRSGVYFEGSLGHLELIFQHLSKLQGIKEDRYFGKWIGITPPDDDSGRVVMHYESTEEFDKFQLLCFVVRRQLAEVCDLRIASISTVVVRYEGQVVLQRPVVLPAGFVNGKIVLPSSVYLFLF